MTKPEKLAFGIGAAALLCFVAAGLAPSPASWLLGWAGLSCAVSSAAYVRNSPGVYGKRDGRLVCWRALPTAVFVGAFRIACTLMRAWRRYPATTRVSRGVWVAGRVEAGDLPREVDVVVDLVSEFPEPRAVRERSGYRFLPVLDGGVPPDEDAVLALLDELADPSTCTLVHCDSGMGRAPTFAALLLVRRGEAADVDDAIRQIQEARPFIHLGSADRAFLAAVAPKVVRDLPERAVAAS